MENGGLVARPCDREQELRLTRMPEELLNGVHSVML